LYEEKVKKPISLRRVVLADRDTQTLDLGDVKIDNLFGGNIPSAQSNGHSHGHYIGNKGLDLFADSIAQPIGAAQQLNPQRPYDPENMVDPTELGLPPLSSMARPLSGVAAIYGLRHRLEEIARPLGLALLLVVLAVVALVLGPDLWQQWQSASQQAAQISDSIKAEIGRSVAPAVSKIMSSDERGAISPINHELIGNPYWALPNRLQVETQALPRLSSAQESRWRYGLAHQYAYQRYRTTREIRLSQNRSAAYLLFEAIEQPKFWTRMEALFGLAEMGLQINIPTVEKGLGGASTSLAANYFRRYLQSRPTAGELYVMRQAIRVVDARTRLVIIQVLAQLGGDMNQLYLIAAAYDPAASVQAWLGQEQNSLQISRLNRQRYQTLMAEYLKSSQAGAGGAEIEELKVEELLETNILNEVQFFQELIDHEEESIAGPEEFNHDGFDEIR